MSVFKRGVAPVVNWMRSVGVGIVHLHATSDGEALYRSIGFTDPHDRALMLHLR